MDNQKLKIIVADDNIGMIDLIPKYLSTEKNIEVIATTRDGEEEIELIKTLKPDIVITDLFRKKGISGLDVIKKVKEFKQCPTFIVITGSYYEEKIDLLNNEQDIHIIRKPMNWKCFNKQIQEILVEMQKKIKS